MGSVSRLTLLLSSAWCAAACTGKAGEPEAPEPQDEPSVVLAAPAFGTQVRSARFTVPAGEEVFLCQLVDGAVEADAAVAQFESALPPGAHHAILFTTTSELPAGLMDRSCAEIFDLDELGPSVFWTAERHTTIDLPSGVALGLKKGTRLAIDLHFINPRRAPIEGEIAINMSFAKPEEVRQLAGVYSLVNFTLAVDPYARKLEQRRCDAKKEMNLLTTRLHMHYSGKGAAVRIVRADGSIVPLATLERAEDAPWTIFPFPGKRVALGDALEWECDYENPTGERMRFGASATDAVMCNAGGYYYPAEAPGEVIQCFK